MRNLIALVLGVFICSSSLNVSYAASRHLAYDHRVTTIDKKRELKKRIVYRRIYNHRYRKKRIIKRNKIVYHKIVKNILPKQERTIKCLSQVIYYEARGEKFVNQIDVARVVLARVDNSKFPDTACSVIHQKVIIHGRVYCQFQWVCRSPGPIKYHSKAYRTSQKAALKAITLQEKIGNFSAQYFNSTGYYNRSKYYLVTHRGHLWFFAMK